VNRQVSRAKEALARENRNAAAMFFTFRWRKLAQSAARAKSHRRELKESRQSYRDLRDTRLPRGKGVEFTAEAVATESGQVAIAFNIPGKPARHVSDTRMEPPSPDRLTKRDIGTALDTNSATRQIYIHTPKLQPIRQRHHLEQRLAVLPRWPTVYETRTIFH
jgi:hypothetical protein